MPNRAARSRRDARGSRGGGRSKGGGKAAPKNVQKRNVALSAAMIVVLALILGGVGVLALRLLG